MQTRFEELEWRVLLSLGVSILTGMDGESVAVLITGNDADDSVFVLYDAAVQQATLNPDSECVLFDAAVKQIIINSGGGNDLVRVRGGGGAAQFVVDGGAGDDSISGSNGHDWLQGGDGNDYITGALGADYVVGGAGDDFLAGGTGGDTLVGAEGADELYGGRGFDMLDDDVLDAVALGEDRTGGIATPPQTLNPDEVVTPPCPPECPPGWES